MKKKIVFLCVHLNYGGAEVKLLTVLKNIDRSHYDCTIVSIEKKAPIGAQIEKLGFKVIYLNSKARLFNISLIWKIAKILIEENPEVLHTSLFYANYFGRIAALFRRPPLIITEEHSMYTEKRLYHIAIDKLLSIFTNRIIVCSNSVLDFTAKQEGIRKDKFYLIHNAVDTERFNVAMDKDALRAEYGYYKDQFIVGVVGSLIPKKALDSVIKAISELDKHIPGLKLLIIGEGESRNKLLDLTVTYEIKDNVDFLGARGDVPQLMKVMDIFVLSSLQEGFPITLIEAMYIGIPVIASNISGIPEVVLDGKNGFLVLPGDSDSIKERILNLYKDPTLRRQLGQNARKTIESGYLPVNYVGRLEKLYSELAEAKSI